MALASRISSHYGEGRSDIGPELGVDREQVAAGLYTGREQTLLEEAARISVIDQDTATAATEVRLLFEPADKRIGEALDKHYYRSYLRRSRQGPVAIGDEWDEFVSRGCGSRRDVILRVESVRGGDEIGEETEFVFEPRQSSNGEEERPNDG